MKITDEHEYGWQLERLKNVYGQLARLEMEKVQLEASLKFFAEKHFYDEEKSEQKLKELAEEVAQLKSKLQSRTDGAVESGGPQG